MNWNELESQKTTQKIDATKNWYFDKKKIGTKNKPLGRLIIKKTLISQIRN